MAIDTASLRKVLELEQKKGCANTAVIGGLDSFMRGWVDRAAGAITNRPLLARLKKLKPPGAGYAQMSTGQRQEFVKNVFAFISELDSTPLPAPKTS